MRRKITKYSFVAVTAVFVFLLLTGDTSDVNTLWVTAPVLVYAFLMLHNHTERVWEYVLERLGGPLLVDGKPRFQIKAKDRLLHRERLQVLRRRAYLSLFLNGAFFGTVWLIMGSSEGAARYTATLSIAWIGASFLYADYSLRKRDDILFDVRIAHLMRHRPMNLFTAVDDICFLYWVASSKTHRRQFGSILRNRRLQAALRRYSVAGRDYYKHAPERWLKLSLVAVLLTCRNELPAETRHRLNKLWDDARSMRVQDIAGIFRAFLRRLDGRDYALASSVESILIQRTPPLPARDTMARTFLHEPSLN